MDPDSTRLVASKARTFLVLGEVLRGTLHAVGAECSLWRLLLAIGGSAIFVSFYFSMSEFYIPKH